MGAQYHVEGFSYQCGHSILGRECKNDFRLIGFRRIPVLRLHMAGHDFVHTVEPLLGQSSGVHGLSPPSGLIGS